ncbi:DUF1707 and DUF4870 domain-containing protein [Auraticoccus cholistanensis]|nr:DUF1707 and DUF4870 domain-containing protein [Auraticoccus cholistanensis]
MNNTYEHPSLNQPVTEEQRDRAEAWLQGAYAEGRISEDEFDRRIGQVISAVTRRDLNLAFYGLVDVTRGSQALGTHPAYQPTNATLARTGQQIGKGAGAVAHFSGLFTSFFGPGLFFLLSPEGGYARKEAAKAFNFQVLSMLTLIVTGIASGLLPDFLDGILFPVIFVGWLVGTIVGGARAAQGDDWQNPLTKAAKLQILRER